MAKKPFIYSRSSWADPYGFALAFLQASPEWRTLEFDPYWGGLCLSVRMPDGRWATEPLTAYELESAVALFLLRSQRSSRSRRKPFQPSHRDVRGVLRALRVIISDRDAWRVAA